MTINEIENEMQKLITEREELKAQAEIIAEKIREISAELRRLRSKKVFREERGEDFGKPRGKVAEMYGKKQKDLTPDELREYYTTMQRERRKRKKNAKSK